MYTKFCLKGSAYLLIGCFAATGLLAAEHHGSVKSAGLPVPGATVTAIQGDKKIVTTTDEQGAYSFPDLADGAWTFEVELPGFTNLSRTVNIAASEIPQFDLRLAPFHAPNQEQAATPRRQREASPGAQNSPATNGPPSNGTPPNRPNFSGRGRGGQGGNAARPSIQQSLAGGGFQSLDVNAQDAGALPAETEPATAGLNGSDLNQSASEAFVVNGSVSNGVNAPQQNDWMGFGPGGFGQGGPGGFGPGGPSGPGANGFGVNGPGGPGAQTGPGPGPGGGGPGGGGGFGGRGGGFGGGGRGGFGGPGRGGRGPAQNGRNSFGNARRNRRMQYNGNIALILDNSALDAKPFSLTGQETPKAAYNHFRTTGALGGPLKIPKLLSGQNTFFFLNYQLTRNRNASVATGLVPTEAEREGIFPGLSVIPISPQAQSLLSFYPMPNFSGNSRYNYQTSLLGIGNQSNVNARVSQTINAKNQLTGNFAWLTGNTTNPNLFGFVDSSNTTGYNTGLQWTHHFTTTLISNLRYNFSRSAGQSTPFFANTQNVSGAAGIQGNDQAPTFWGPPNLSFANGITGLSGGNFSLNHNSTNQVSENLIWIHGKHNFTFGGDFRRLDFNQLSQQNPRGSFVFTGAFSGNAFADFLEGYPATSSIAYGNADKYYRALWLDGFVNDDWRIRSNLSINVGLRWDFQAPVTELYNRLVNLNIGPGFTSESAVCATAPPSTASSPCTLASQAGYPSSLLRPDYHEFQPRIGIAWRPFTQRSTVVRAGYGIYYNTSVYQPLANQMAQQSPLSYSVTQPNSLSNPYTIADAFLTPAINAVPQTYALDPNFKIGYLHYWQASVQQNLSPSIILTLTYHGNEGTHQLQEFLPNTFPAGSPASPYPSGYVYITSNANSNYNAGSVQLQRRFRSGFSWNGMYTFSKALDDSQGLGGRGGPGGAYAQNWLDLTADRSLSSFNRTHTLNLTAQYSTGQGTTGGTLLNGWKGALAKDWTFSVTSIVASGLPETPIILTRVATGTGITGTVRADYIGGSLVPTLPGYGFNTAAFADPLPGQYGDAGRNIITGPMEFNLNASAGRVFRLGERRSFDIRFDSTNVLNHVTYTSWNTTLGNAQFGLPVSANAMRSMQLTLRFRF
ncbi:MAG TPA: carboxypeptidase regulatory-like domain-containing protein [Bryobacteraceae bacterium]|nr:carboxypeptidase regulatory-like domain-containing protein [Bryobacteraceae bacterium]